MLSCCRADAERELLNADTGREWYTSCGATANQACKTSSRAGRLPAMHNRQPRHPIPISVVVTLPWTTVALISKAYNTEIVKGILYPLRSWSSGQASL